MVQAKRNSVQMSEASAPWTTSGQVAAGESAETGPDLAGWDPLGQSFFPNVIIWLEFTSLSKCLEVRIRERAELLAADDDVPDFRHATALRLCRRTQRTLFLHGPLAMVGR
jgi:hypothetical protein